MVMRVTMAAWFAIVAGIPQRRANAQTDPAVAPSRGTGIGVIDVTSGHRKLGNRWNIQDTGYGSFLVVWQV